MIALVGAGKMGYSLLYSMLQGNGFSEKEVTVFDKSSERINVVQENFNVPVAASALEAVKAADAVLLAVKPRDMQALLEEIGKEGKGKLFISIAAGIKMSFIEHRLAGARVARAMPNIACLIQEMAGAFALNSNASEKDRQMVKRIFSAAGKVVEVKEEQLDAVTALSGSGPAFFTLFADALAAEAVKQGLGKGEARLLAAQTMLGTARLLESGKMSGKELIDAVASPGGTTEAGLGALEEKKAKEAIAAAVKAAAEKSRELSKGA